MKNIQTKLRPKRVRVKLSSSYPASSLVKAQGNNLNQPTPGVLQAFPSIPATGTNIESWSTRDQGHRSGKTPKFQEQNCSGSNGSTIHLCKEGGPGPCVSPTPVRGPPANFKPHYWEGEHGLFFLRALGRRNVKLWGGGGAGPYPPDPPPPPRPLRTTPRPTRRVEPPPPPPPGGPERRRSSLSLCRPGPGDGGRHPVQGAHRHVSLRGAEVQPLPGLHPVLRSLLLQLLHLLRSGSE